MELKPCPFCGKPGTFYVDRRGFKTHIAVCPDVECIGHEVCGSAEAWNRRCPVEGGEDDATVLARRLVALLAAAKEGK